MRILKVIAWVCMPLFFVQCHKDAKIEPIVRILPNGSCYILLNTGPRSNSSRHYYMKDNIIYPVLYNSFKNEITSICFSKMAGYLYLDKYDSVRISPIKMKLSNGDPCSLMSDIHGEDTYELHLSNISSGISNIGSRKYFSGNFYYKIGPGNPHNKIDGTFTLSVK